MSTWPQSVHTAQHFTVVNKTGEVQQLWSDQVGSMGDNLHSVLLVGHSLSEMIDGHLKL